MNGEGPVRVLHVDDDQSFAELTEEFLVREDDRFVVETVSGGRDGLALLRSDSFDCVVSDYEMPGMDGLEFLERVREEYANLPVILFTGKGSEEVASEAIAKGVTDYLQKESGRQQYELLANRILNAVDQRDAARRAADLERVRRVLRDVNQTLVREETPEQIELRVCEIISDAEPYRFAWIGDHDHENRTVEPRVAAGQGAGYLDTIEITTDDSETGKGPTGRAVRDRELVVMQNIPEDDDYEPWREDALERGYQSSAAVPLIYQDTSYGVLNVYADRTYAFDEAERELLAELGEDIAHALSHANLRVQRRREKRVLENVPVGVYRTRPGSEGRVIEANPALADIFDADSPEDIVGRKVKRFSVDPAERTALSDRLDEEGIVRNEKLRQETLEGEEIWVAVTAMRTEEDNEVYFDGIIREITDERERERQLRLFRNAVEASGHSIYFTDTDGTIEYVNPAFEEITGYSAEEAIGQNAGMLQSGEHDETFYEEMWETILSGEVWRNEIVNKSKTGERYVSDQTIAPVSDESGDIEHFVAVNANITEQKEREQALQQSRER